MHIFSKKSYSSLITALHAFEHIYLSTLFFDTIKWESASFLYFSAKRPRLESSNRKEYDIQSAAMNEWLDKTEINLELLTTDPPNPEEKLTLEEQMVLIKVKYIVLVEIHLKIRGSVIASMGRHTDIF